MMSRLTSTARSICVTTDCVFKHLAPTNAAEQAEALFVAGQGKHLDRAATPGLQG